jgi:hypothetical protein
MSDNKDRVYAPAMNWSAPRDEAPDFIKAKVGIKVLDEDGNDGEFIKFLRDNAKSSGWINFEMKESQDGRYYFELDTWEPKPQKDEAPF